MDKNMSVIGAGTMGWGIAQVFAAAGYSVALCDRDISFAEKGKAAMSASLQKLVDREKMTADAADKILANVTPYETQNIPKCSLVVEAIYEDMSVKKELFKKLEGLLPTDTIFATNTSSLSITELAGCLSESSRFVGMHFFNPAAVMKLVEVIGGAQTCPDVINKVVAISEEIGKTPVKVNEAAGFVVNRILIPMINEAVGILAEGVSTAWDIDTAMKLGANHPIGPLALGDLVGLDVCLAIMEVLQAETGEDKYRPHPLLKKMVRAGTLGRKTKKGFYEY
ncbi:MAG: 3-hydroxyacyl-CoA dehydrogenase NAD-binding domain-containing protein [Defluviitaleaceae bacterium]|nr:3-hydroxyacyl-CoA dehydrogenase NAD-binding domain-containing protein [Defluviitaleaceae bacterium]